MKYKKLAFIVSALFCLLDSCSTFKAGIYLSSIDPKEIEKPLEKEPEVKLFLEQVYEFPDIYTMSIYTRTAIKSTIKKSPKYIHAYYVINGKDDKFYTLSFNGTRFSPYSKGVWVIDSESDLASYKSFLQGKNIWDVERMELNNGINMKASIFNILIKLNDHMQYYYKDHLNNKPDMDNCITAVNETFVTK